MSKYSPRDQGREEGLQPGLSQLAAHRCQVLLLNSNSLWLSGRAENSAAPVPGVGLPWKQVLDSCHAQRGYQQAGTETVPPPAWISLVMSPRPFLSVLRRAPSQHVRSEGQAVTLCGQITWLYHQAQWQNPLWTPDTWSPTAKAPLRGVSRQGQRWLYQRF